MPGVAAPGSRISAARRRATRCTQKLDKQDDALTDSMKMFKWGVEGGKPAGSKPGMQPEWFYKGNGRNVVGLRLAPRLARLRRGSRRRARARRLLPHRRRTASRAGSGSPSATSSPTTSPSAATIYCWRIRSCASAASGPMLNTGALPGAPRRHEPHPPRRRRCCGRSRSSPARQHVPHASPTSNTTTSSTGSIACRATCTCISSAPRRVSFVDNIRVQPGDEFEIDLPALGAPLVNKLADRAGRPSHCDEHDDAVRRTRGNTMNISRRVHC